MTLVTREGCHRVLAPTYRDVEAGHRGPARLGPTRGGHMGQVLDDFLGVLRLSCSRLATKSKGEIFLIRPIIRMHTNFHHECFNNNTCYVPVGYI